MKNTLIDKKSGLNKSAMIFLWIILFFRAICMFDPLKTGLDFSGSAFAHGFKNILFLLLTALFCFMLCLIVSDLNKTTGKEILPLAILWLSEPKYTVLQSNIIELIIGILMIIAVVIIVKSNCRTGDIATWVFSFVSGMLLPMSLFSTFPIVLCVRYFSEPNGKRRTYPLVLSAASFAVASAVRLMLYKVNISFFVNTMFEYSNSSEFIDKVGYTLYSSDIYVYIITAVSVFLLSLYYYRISRSVNKIKRKNSVKIKKQLQEEIAVAGIAMLLTVFGEIVYHQYSIAFTLVWIIFIMIARAGDDAAEKLLVKVNTFINNNYLVFVFVLMILAGISIRINGGSSLYNKIGFDFIA